MSVVVKFGERLRSVGAWLEDEILSIVLGFNTLIGQQHYLDTGEHADITCDSVTSSGHRWKFGPWLLDDIGNATAQAVIRPPQIAANQNNYSPSGIETAIGIDLDSDTTRSITGIAVVDRQRRIMFVGNKGTSIINLIHESSSSVATNRFSFNSDQDYFLGPREYIWLYYDTDAQRWRTIGQNRPVYVDAFLPTTSQSINDNTATKVTFSAENTDPFSLFDSVTNYRFNVPTLGTYWVSASVMFQPNGSAATTLRTDIYVNGTSRVSAISGCAAGPVYVSVPISRLMPLAAGDYIEIFATQVSGASMNIFRATESTWLSIFRYH